MKYDVIIIGGGLSGLTAGIIAASRGKKTLLLEKHTTVGGLLAGFTRKGFYFDSGLSRVMGASVKRPLKELKLLKKVNLKSHQAVWNVEGNWIEYKQLNLFFEGLARLFPDEAGVFKEFYEKEVKPRENVYKILFTDTSKMNLVRKYMHISYLLCAFPFIAKILSSKELESDVLGKYFNPKGKAYTFLKEKEDEIDYRGNMSFVTKVGKWYTQMFNVYPSEGFQGLANTMADEFKVNGGEVRTSVAVRKIVIENDIAIGVELGKKDTIETLFADRIICSIDLNKAFRDLIGTEHIDADLISRLDRSQLSSPIPILFLGLNIPASRLNEYFHSYDEIFYYPAIETGKDEKGFYLDHPMVMHSSCFIAPTHAPANKSNLQIYLSDPGKEWMDNWGIKDGKRTDAYRNIKSMVTEQILETLEKIVPDIKDRSLIEVCELGTPFTIERYTGNTNGSGLGYSLDKDFINSKKLGKYFDHYEGIKNLFFAGQQTGYPGGVVNAFGSGKHAGKSV
jgi:phytoene dehydrogenase-like protein